MRYLCTSHMIDVTSLVEIFCCKCSCFLSFYFTFLHVEDEKGRQERVLTPPNRQATSSHPTPCDWGREREGGSPAGKQTGRNSTISERFLAAVMRNVMTAALRRGLRVSRWLMIDLPIHHTHTLSITAW